LNLPRKPAHRVACKDCSRSLVREAPVHRRSYRGTVRFVNGRGTRSAA
jgi:hypothetical protein